MPVQDILLDPGSHGDRAGGDIVSANAQLLLEQCVDLEAKGGLVKDFSKSFPRLDVLARPWSFCQILCLTMPS